MFIHFNQIIVSSVKKKSDPKPKDTFIIAQQCRKIVEV